jgi:predicted DCC family thiol-disulfide oxidoreductase YuxK
LLYNPLTYFVLLVMLRLPDALHLRRWIALTTLILFSPLFEPIGNRAYRYVAANRSRWPGILVSSSLKK